MKRFLCLLAALSLCLCAAAEATSVGTEEGMEKPTMVFVSPTSEVVGIVGEVSGAEVTVEPTVEPTAEPSAEPTAEPTPEPSAEPALRLSGVSIGIDPGHQTHANSDLEPNSPNSSEMKQKVLSGTAGVRTGIPEYETNLTISLQLRDALEALGATVYMTRETNDVDISNMERALFFNEKNVDLGLRIHCNGASSSSVHGAGTYARKTGEKQAESELAAGLLLDAICEYTGARRDGVFLRDNYTGQNWSVVPCVMIEMGYMSNPEEDVKLNDPEYQQKMVAGIAEGVCRYIETMAGTGGYWTLQQGSRGSNVQVLQEQLIELGYLNDTADGIYGPNTAAAVTAFQQANSLEATGIADPDTQKALFGEDEADAGEAEPVQPASPEPALG